MYVIYLLLLICVYKLRSDNLINTLTTTTTMMMMMMKTLITMVDILT